MLAEFQEAAARKGGVRLYGEYLGAITKGCRVIQIPKDDGSGKLEDCCVFSLTPKFEHSAAIRDPQAIRLEQDRQRRQAEEERTDPYWLPFYTEVWASENLGKHRERYRLPLQQPQVPGEDREGDDAMVGALRT